MSRFTIVILLVLLVLPVWSQQGSVDLCQLTIHVRMADDREAGSYLQVQLLSPVGTPVSVGTTTVNCLPVCRAANAQALLQAGIFPAPTNGTQFQGTPSTPTNVREEIVRIDHEFNSKNRFASTRGQTFG